MTAASATASWDIRLFSRATEEIHPSALYEILGTVLYLDVAVLVYGDDVAGPEPAVLGELVGALFGVEVRPETQGPRISSSPIDSPSHAAKPSSPRALTSMNAPGMPCLALPVPLVLGVIASWLLTWQTLPRGVVSVMPQACSTYPAMALVEGPDHTLRRRRPADDHGPQAGELIRSWILVELVQDAEEDGRNTGGDRDLLVCQVLEQALGVEMAPAGPAWPRRGSR